MALFIEPIINLELSNSSQSLAFDIQCTHIKFFLQITFVTTVHIDIFLCVYTDSYAN